MTPKAAYILIVEDDADLGFLLQEVLKREGHRVDIVETGAEALTRQQRGTTAHLEYYISEVIDKYNLRSIAR